MHDATAGYRQGAFFHGRYEIHKSLGVGRLGTVLDVVDLEVGIEVALKVIHPGLIPTESSGHRFLDRLRTLVPIKHEGMARIYDINVDKQNYYIVRQLLDGVPLRRLIDGRRARGAVFTLDEIIPIVEQMVDLFETGGLVHGALFPEKIWIMPKHLKVVDMGLAAALPPKAVWHRLRSLGPSAGYTPPELERGHEPDGRSDVYTLAALVGEMLTQTTFEQQAQIFDQAGDAIPAEIQPILRQALQPIPEDRFETPTELLDSLNEATGRKRVSLVPPPPKAAAPAPLPRRTIPAKPPTPEAMTEADDHTEQTNKVSMDEVIRAHSDELISDEKKEQQTAPGQRKTIPPPVPSAAKKKRKTASEVPPPSPAVMSSAAVAGVPPYVPPPSTERADDPVDINGDAATTSRDAAQQGVDNSATQRREVTQEIEMDALEEVNELTEEGTDSIEVDDDLPTPVPLPDTVVPQLPTAEEHASSSASQLLKQRAENLEGIDGRLLRAAAKLEKAKVGELTVEKEEAPPEEKKEDDWRERISSAPQDRIISFIQPPFVEQPMKVRGFPKNQKRTTQPHPSITPPPKPPAKRTTPRKREPGTVPSPPSINEDNSDVDADSQFDH